MVLLDWMLSPLISKESKAMKRLLSAITCLTLLCSACSSGPHTGEPQGDPTAGKDLNYSKFSDVKATFDNEHMEIILPLNKYMMSTPEGLITLSANIYNNNDCSVARGVPSGSTGDGVEIKPHFQYGIWNKDYVSKYGYSIDHDVTKIRIVTLLPHKEYSEAQMEVYSECQNTVRQLGDFPARMPEANTIVAQADLEADSAWMRDEDVKKWHGEWEQCLKDKGISIPKDYYWAPEVPGDKEKEIEVALADLDCKDSTGYFMKTMNRRAQYQAAAIEKYKPQLDEYRKNLDAQIEEGKKVLADHGEPLPSW